MTQLLAAPSVLSVCILLGIHVVNLPLVTAFQPPVSLNHRTNSIWNGPVSSSSAAVRPAARPSVNKLKAAAEGYDNEDDDEDDYDDYIDDTSLGDWRAFRANLASSGIPTGTSSDGSSADASSSKEPNAIDADAAAKNPSQQRPRSVSKKNEELLKSQNEQLYKEYETGVWAHAAPAAEVGGLLCRLPLEAEIYRNSEYSPVGKKLQAILEDTNNDGGRPAMSSLSGEDDNNDGMGSSPGVSFSLTGAKTLWWYRKARQLIEEETAKVTSSAVGGEIDASALSKDSIDFLNLYLSHQDTWQEVCLVTEKNDNGLASTLVLNRPMSFSLSDSIARLVLFGAYRNDLGPEELELLVKFSIAFDKEIFVYLGGPDELEVSASIVSGIADLNGSKEIAPNTGIYIGGTETIEAAVHGIMQGMHSPLDFRFFVGKHRYLDGRLDLECLLGKYQPIACSRALALKQCKALPKPLFHEVMELSGGELAELSKLELMKRDDIQLETLDGDE